MEETTSREDLETMVKAVVAYRHEMSCPAISPVDGLCDCGVTLRNQKLERAINKMRVFVHAHGR